MSTYLPAALLSSLQGLPGFEQSAFIAVHEAGERVTSLRLNHAKLQAPGKTEAVLEALSPAAPVTRVPWAQHGYYLPQRPSFTLDPFFHAGAYYVQEASSMFLEHAIRQTCDLAQPLKVLDLCAAPGGKSTLLQSVISADSLLVANEVIRARAGMLADNISRWGAANVVVTNNDPRDMARLPGFFDVMVVDAPCSGSGLFRREPEAVAEWSPENVALCCQRQQRILADAWPALRDGGILIYSTCSYSKEEDEDIMDWIVSSLEAENIPIPIDPSWNIVTTRSDKRNCEGYRFYPDKVQGEGLFIACFRKTGGDTWQQKKQRDTLSALPKKDREKLQPWVRDLDQYFVMEHQGEAIILPPAVTAAVAVLQQQLYLRKAGVKAGQLTAKELAPDHQLAMSTLLPPTIQEVALTLTQALQYLRKEDPALPVAMKGWALMQYGQMPLGWAKILLNRINNYYPKELRILKEI
ncbi:RNA methyltransferase [Chitinophaga agrisoli]|uniref:RNA methyltransferase n=1 Tax=Chitinophaga agrisoli TaxID=2607653 RepID=A0A5B2VNY2_9BACT|nr:RNA methyltransferase [Chitinophaga agrisoli]KAA2240086.1 RNA methyltransferase [Chitinophaga agrisoli]